MKYFKFLTVLAVLFGMLIGSITLGNSNAGSTGFDDIIVEDASVTGSIVIGGEFTQNGDLAHFENDIEVAGDITGMNIVTMRKPVYETSAITATNGMTLSVGYGSYLLSAAGPVTVTLGACSINGQMVSLYGDDAQTITIADTNIRSSDGNAVTLGQYDVVAMQCFDAEWNLVSKSANQ